MKNEESRALTKNLYIFKRAIECSFYRLFNNHRDLTGKKAT